MSQPPLRAEARILLHGAVWEMQAASAIAARLVDRGTGKPVAHTTVTDAFRPAHVNPGRATLEPTAETLVQTLATLVALGRADVVPALLRLYGAPTTLLVVCEDEPPESVTARQVADAAMVATTTAADVLEQVRLAVADEQIDWAELRRIQQAAADQLAAVQRLVGHAMAAVAGGVRR